MIEKKVRELIEEEVSKMGIIIDSVVYEKEGSNYFLRIIIDRLKPIDIDTCVEVTHVINPILDILSFNDSTSLNAYLNASTAILTLTQYLQCLLNFGK